MLSLMLSYSLLEFLIFNKWSYIFLLHGSPCKLGSLPVTYILGDRNKKEIGLPVLLGEVMNCLELSLVEDQEYSTYNP